MIRIGEKIKELRLSKKISQEKFSEDLNVTSSAVSKWENNLSYPDLEKIVDIANYFKVSVDYLLDYKIKDNNVDKLIKELETAYKEKTFPYTPEDLEKILRVFDQNFKVNYMVGKYLSYYGMTYDDSGFDLALKAFENAIELINQNDDPEITEYSIKNSIIELYIKMENPKKAIEYIDKSGLHAEHEMTKVMAYQMLKRHDKVLEHFPKGFLTSTTRIVNGLFYLVVSFFEKKDYQEVKKIGIWEKNFLHSIIIKDSEWGFRLLNLINSFILFSKYALNEDYEKELEEMLYYSKVTVDPNTFKSDAMIFNYGTKVSIFSAFIGSSISDDSIKQFDSAIEIDKIFIKLKEEYIRRLENEE